MPSDATGMQGCDSCLHGDAPGNVDPCLGCTAKCEGDPPDWKFSNWVRKPALPGTKYLLFR